MKNFFTDFSAEVQTLSMVCNLFITQSLRILLRKIISYYKNKFVKVSLITSPLGEPIEW